MRALICGISGQDGAYLAEFLLRKRYTVVGTSRDAQTSSFSGLKRLGIIDNVQLESPVFWASLPVTTARGQASATETPALRARSRRRPSNPAVPMPSQKQRRSGW